MTPKQIQHLYWRIGFGISPNLVQRLSGKHRKEIVNNLFLESNITTPLKIDLSDFQYISPKTLKDKKALRKFIEFSKTKLKDFNYAWIQRLSNPKELLRERMTLFWANHFVCRDNNILFVQQYNNTLREHALGHFGDFVKAISREPAMLKYLNNKQNKKRKPNENFARELMELFTLGKDHYTEQDIKESSRAFTGYNHTFKGLFFLNKKHHDYGFKSFFGKMGRYDGDDIIDIILEQEQCAQFICEKIYSYFVNEELNENHIKQMVSVFYPNYNIEELMQFVLNSNWFYYEENIGIKIKSPIEFLLGLDNVVPIYFKRKNDVFIIQKLLGQVLLRPPNVAGWKGGKQWIDSNTILLRLRLPSLLLNDAHISTKSEGGFNDSLNAFIKKEKKKNNPFTVDKDWNHFVKAYQKVSVAELKEHLLLSQCNPWTEKYLNTLSKASKREYCIQLMSLPEYQMC